MSTSKDPGRKPSTFDDIIHTNPLLFRLHSPKFSHTFFDDDSKILFASRNWKKYDNREEIFHTLKALKEKPTSFEKDAVARHITTWSKHTTGPLASDFISLTYNFWYVLWEWKRRRSRQPPQGQSEVSRPEDDFQVIVFETSGLKGRARLGTEVVAETKEDAEAYRFTQAHAEVIVPDFIEPPTTLGAVSLSQLQGFIPPWCRDLPVTVEQYENSESKMNKTLSFKDFTQRLRDLKSSANEDGRVPQSLRFSLKLLAPILASGEQWHQRADNESAVDSANRDPPNSRALDWSDHDSTSEACSSTAARPPKRRRLAEPEEEPLKVLPESVNAGQGDKDLERLRACKYIRAILADIWYMEGMEERQALQETCTDDVDKLLKRYMETIDKYVLYACRRFHS